MNKINHINEWIKQARYDLETGMAMLQSGRHIYCVFMCHLSVEKILKAAYLKCLNKNPPKTHSLVYLAQVSGLALSDDIKDFCNAPH